MTLPSVSVLSDGGIALGALTLISFIVLFIVSRPKQFSDFTFNKILLSGLLTSALIHVFMILTGNSSEKSELLMWMLISFPFVGGVSVTILLILKSLATSILNRK